MKRLADEPFVLLGVNSDRDRELTKKFLQQEKITWRSWWDGGSTYGPIQTSYNVSHWPTIYVLDHKGVIRYIDVRNKQLEEAVDKLLDELEKEKEKGGQDKDK